MSVQPPSALTVTASLFFGEEEERATRAGDTSDAKRINDPRAAGQYLPPSGYTRLDLVLTAAICRFLLRYFALQ